MNMIENKDIRNRLAEAFPKFYINRQFEIIIYPEANSYFSLGCIENEEDLKAKIIEWLSREACKSVSDKSQKYHLNGINKFLSTNFTQNDMMEIYTYLGNRCNHAKTLRFINSNYDMTILSN